MVAPQTELQIHPFGVVVSGSASSFNLASSLIERLEIPSFRRLENGQSGIKQKTF